MKRILQIALTVGLIATAGIVSSGQISQGLPDQVTASEAATNTDQKPQSATVNATTPNIDQGTPANTVATTDTPTNAQDGTLAGATMVANLDQGTAKVNTSEVAPTSTADQAAKIEETAALSNATTSSSTSTSSTSVATSPPTSTSTVSNNTGKILTGASNGGMGR